MTEPLCEPENQTICESTKSNHQWIWDDTQDDYFCDECGVLESRQE